MEFITITQFKTFCNNSKCLRKTLITNKCSNESKQINCYNKYLKREINKLELLDTNKYDEQKEFREKILQRDKTCRIWNILNREEKEFILKNYYDEYIIYSKTLDVCHIIPRSEAPHLKFEESNAFLGSRYFHILIDAYKHPVYRSYISKEERLYWCNSALQGVRK